MKEVKAIIQPFRLRAVVEGLHELGDLPGITMSHVDSYSVVHTELEPRPKCKLEIMVNDAQVDRVVQTIRTHAHTGNPGDGRVFVIDVASAVEIRGGRGAGG